MSRSHCTSSTVFFNRLDPFVPNFLSSHSQISSETLRFTTADVINSPIPQNILEKNEKSFKTFFSKNIFSEKVGLGFSSGLGLGLEFCSKSISTPEFENLLRKRKMSSNSMISGIGFSSNVANWRRETVFFDSRSKKMDGLEEREKKFSTGSRFLSSIKDETFGDSDIYVLLDSAGREEKENELNVDPAQLASLWTFLHTLPDPNSHVAPAVELWGGQPGCDVTLELARATVNRLQRSRKYRQAFQLSEYLIKNSRRFKVGSVDYKKVIQNCCRWMRYQFAEKLFLNFPQEYQTEEVYLGFVLSAAKKGFTKNVDEHLEKMKIMGIEISVASFNARLIAYGKRGPLGKIEEILEDMRLHGIKPNRQSYNIIINAFGKAQNFEGMYKFYEKLKEEWGEGDNVTYNSMFWCLFSAEKNEEGEKIVEICRNGPGFSLSTYLSLIWSYSRQGKIEKMESVFNEMREKKLPTFSQIWMARIHGYGKSGNPIMAKKVFDEMVLDQIPPLTKCYNCLLFAYTNNKEMEDAKTLFEKMKSEGIFPDSVSYQYMLKGYMKVGNFEAARKIIQDLIPLKNRRQLRPVYMSFMDLLETFAEKGSVKTVEELANSAEKLYKPGTEIYTLWLKSYIVLRERMEKGGKGREEREQREGEGESGDGGVVVEGEGVYAVGVGAGVGERVGEEEVEKWDEVVKISVEEFNENVDKILRRMKRGEILLSEEGQEFVRKLGFENRAKDLGLMGKESRETRTVGGAFEIGGVARGERRGGEGEAGFVEESDLLEKQLELL